MFEIGDKVRVKGGSGLGGVTPGAVGEVARTISRKGQPDLYEVHVGVTVCGGDGGIREDRLSCLREWNELELINDLNEHYALTPAYQAKADSIEAMPDDGSVSDGSTASYYELPTGASELQDLISHRDMNAQIGEIFRACYRYGQASHSPRLRDARKIKFYIDAEIARLEKLEVSE